MINTLTHCEPRIERLIVRGAAKVVKQSPGGIDTYYGGREICRASVQMLNNSAKARQISLPTFGWDRDGEAL